METEAFTPEGRVMLDLENPADIITFGGQEAVDKFLATAAPPGIQAHNVKVFTERLKSTYLFMEGPHDGLE